MPGPVSLRVCTWNGVLCREYGMAEPQLGREFTETEDSGAAKGPCR